MVGVPWKQFAETGAIKAKSVIIAAGGFVMNPEMVAEHTPKLGQPRAPNITGWWRRTSWATPTMTDWASGWAYRPAGPPSTWTRSSSPRPPIRPSILLTGVIVNKDGKRFVAEDSYHSRTSAFVWSSPSRRGVSDRRRGTHRACPTMPLIPFIDG